MRPSTRFRHSLLTLTCVVLASCASPGPRPLETVDRGWTEKGIASWYGKKFHGRRTANGEVYDMYGMTAAHKRLPFDTLVEVNNLDNGRSVRVRINDRGPFVRGRIIDLTYTAAEKIGMVGPGTARVRIRVVGNAEVDGRYFTIQVAAYSSVEAARELKRRLGAYPNVRIESANGLHRVLVGKFVKEAKARNVAERLRSDGYEAFLRAEVRR
jgi:rare lipoprotein A